MPFHSLDGLLIFIAVQVLVALSPGPAVLLMVSQGMQHGPRAAILGACGIQSGNICYFILSAAGLGALLLASSWIFDALRLAGAAYLMWLGASMVLQSGKAATTGTQPPQTDRHRLFLQGMFTQLANPKALVYFTALLPQFIDPRGDMASQCAVIGILTVIIELPICIAYAWLGHKGSGILGGGPGSRWFGRAMGGFLIAAGIRLAMSRLR
jgi:homoserine/homoserine lactone efflux protein